MLIERSQNSKNTEKKAGFSNKNTKKCCKKRKFGAFTKENQEKSSSLKRTGILLRKKSKKILYKQEEISFEKITTLSSATNFETLKNSLINTEVTLKNMSLKLENPKENVNFQPTNTDLFYIDHLLSEYQKLDVFF